MQLTHWLSAQDLSNKQFAKRLGASPSAVGRWRRGMRTPSAPYMRKIVTLTKGQVTPSDFFMSAGAECAPAPRAPESGEEA